MELVLSHTTALEYMRLRHADYRRAHTVSLPRKVEGPSAAQVAAIHQGDLAFLSDPLHFLVTESGARCRREHALCHVLPFSYSRNSLRRVGDGILVPSPELCFVLMAPELSLPKLVELGYELCGTYGLFPSCADGFISREPLTSVRLLSSFISRAEGMRGVAKAQCALRYVRGGSASPMETVLVELLTLPHRFGGSQLPAPVANYQVNVGPGYRSMGMKSCYRCDLCWPDAKLVIEYDSDQRHTGPERIAEDSIRRNALMFLGMEVVTVTSRQIMRLGEYEKIVKFVAKRMSIRLRVRQLDWKYIQAGLRAELLPPINR